MRRYEYGDPAKVLERRGEDCSHCKHLGTWWVGADSVTVCTNQDAPPKKREHAPASRCHWWKHEKQDSGV